VKLRIGQSREDPRGSGAFPAPKATPGRLACDARVYRGSTEVALSEVAMTANHKKKKNKSPRRRKTKTKKPQKRKKKGKGKKKKKKKTKKKKKKKKKKEEGREI